LNTTGTDQISNHDYEKRLRLFIQIGADW